MSGDVRRQKTKAATARALAFAPHPDDAKHVRRAFEASVEQADRAAEVTPEQLRRWAETGEWPESSG